MSDCRPSLVILRSESPWREFTRTWEEEEAGLRVAAVANTSGLVVPTHLQGDLFQGQPMLAIDPAARRVVVQAALFDDLFRPDLTAIAPGERVRVGRVRELAAWKDGGALVDFLLRAQILRTYAHLEAHLCLKGIGETETTMRVSFGGYHSYCTRECHDAPLAFAVLLDKESGEIQVEGGP